MENETIKQIQEYFDKLSNEEKIKLREAVKLSIYLDHHKEKSGFNAFRADNKEISIVISLMEPVPAIQVIAKEFSIPSEDIGYILYNPTVLNVKQ